MRFPFQSPALRALCLLLGLASVALGCGGRPARPAGSPPPAKPGHASKSPQPRRVARLVVPRGHRADRTVHVPVLTYHRVNPLRPGAASIETDLTLEPSQFAAQMSALRRHGYHSITQEQLFGALYRHGHLPPKPVLITVDDGYRDDVRHILPILRREHLKATFFVITGRLHEPGFMNASQIRRLDVAGMDVGDHTRSHVDLRRIDAGALQREVIGSGRVLQRILGHPVYFFAYPFGNFDGRVVAEVRRAGFAMAFTTMGGSRESTAHPLTMPRIHVGRALTARGLLSTLGAN